MRISIPTVLWQQLSLFAFTFVLGVTIGHSLVRSFDAAGGGAELPTLDALDLLAALAVGTVLFLVFFKVFKGKGLPHRIVFGLVLLGGMNLTASVFFPPAAALLVALALLVWRFLSPSIVSHNVTIALAFAGVGASLGIMLSTLTVVVLLAILSVYDYIAVYTTKHMVTMARVMIEHRVVLGFIVPEKIRHVRARLAGAKPGEGFSFIGGGDVVLPMLLVVSVAGTSLAAAAVVSFGALLGVCADSYVFTHQNRRLPMPALPLIALGAVFGLLAATPFI